MPSTKKALPRTGAWLAGRQPSAFCVDSPETCLGVFYKVAGLGVSCSWTIQMNADGQDGKVLEQNEDATRYFLRRLSDAETAEMVIARSTPIYPPIATAAHVQGQVAITVIVDEGGSIERLLINSGPEMLRSAAADAAKAWRFKPLLGGAHAIRYESSLRFDFMTSGPGMSSVQVSP